MNYDGIKWKAWASGYFSMSQQVSAPGTSYGDTFIFLLAFLFNHRPQVILRHTLQVGVANYATLYLVKYPPGSSSTFFASSSVVRRTVVLFTRFCSTIWPAL